MNEVFDIELRNFQKQNLETKLLETETTLSELLNDYVICKHTDTSKDVLGELKNDINKKYIELNTLSVALYGTQYFTTEYKGD